MKKRYKHTCNKKLGICNACLMDELRKENTELQTENKRLMKALKFYADEINYSWPECDEKYIIQDNGDIAREALKVEKKVK